MAIKRVEKLSQEEVRAFMTQMLGSIPLDVGTHVIRHWSGSREGKRSLPPALVDLLLSPSALTADWKGFFWDVFGRIPESLCGLRVREKPRGALTLVISPKEITNAMILSALGEAGVKGFDCPWFKRGEEVSAPGASQTYAAWIMQVSGVSDVEVGSSLNVPQFISVREWLLLLLKYKWGGVESHYSYATMCLGSLVGVGGDGSDVWDR